MKVNLPLTLELIPATPPPPGQDICPIACTPPAFHQLALTLVQCYGG